MKDLKIQRPDWYNSGGTITVSSVSHWFDTHVQPLNDLLARGVEVSSMATLGDCGIDCEKVLWGHEHRSQDTHKAILINIQPIKRETAEDVLKEFIEAYNLHGPMYTNYPYFIDRAKAALENEGQ